MRSYHAVSILKLSTSIKLMCCMFLLLLLGSGCFMWSYPVALTNFPTLTLYFSMSLPQSLCSSTKLSYQFSPTHMHVHPYSDSDHQLRTAYQQIPRKPLDDVMWYSCCSKNDISGERASYSFHSKIQRFLAPLPKSNVPLQLPHSPTPSQYWTSCFPSSHLCLQNNYTIWSLTFILDENAFTMLWLRQRSPDKNCCVCKAPPRPLWFTWGPPRITSEWVQVVHLRRLCSLRLNVVIYYTERYSEPRDRHYIISVFSWHTHWQT